MSETIESNNLWLESNIGQYMMKIIVIQESLYLIHS